MSGRTLVVTNDFPPRVGGIESFVLAMVERMPPDSVVVHTARQPGAREFDAGLRFPVLRDRSRVMLPTPAIIRRSVRIARETGCDSVWFGAAAPLGLMAPALRSAGVRRTVATTHGHEVWWARTPGARRLLRRIGEANDVLTYLGSYTRDQVARALTRDAAARMVQLTPGVDDAVFHPGVDGREVRARYGLGDERPVVVCVSRLVQRKGQDTLIRSLPLIQRRVPGAAVLIVGDGPRRTALRSLAESLGVTEDVVFAGAHPWADLPPFFAAGDVFCMPTRTRRAGFEVEGLGIVYLEASATGLPVVAGRSGGAPDAVRDGVTGYVVDGSSADAVADRVAGLLLDSDRSAAMGRAGRAWVEQCWRWDDLAARLQSLLDPTLPSS